MRAAARVLLTSPSGTIPPAAFALNALFLFGVASWGVFFALGGSRYQWQWADLWAFRALFIQGWLVTVAVSAVALATSLTFGVLTALARRSRVVALRLLAGGYVEFIRGTPLLVQIFVLYYLLGDAFGLTDRYVAAVFSLSLFCGAYISEIVRAGIESVGNSQLESARAVGFTPFQIYRYVVMPQAIRQILPPLAGQFASLIKDSSLLSVISVNEFAFNAANVASTTYSTLEAYLPLAIGYLILTLPISWISRSLEARLRYET